MASIERKLKLICSRDALTLPLRLGLALALACVLPAVVLLDLASLDHATLEQRGVVDGGRDMAAPAMSVIATPLALRRTEQLRERSSRQPIWP